MLHNKNALNVLWMVKRIMGYELQNFKYDKVLNVMLKNIFNEHEFGNELL